MKARIPNSWAFPVMAVAMAFEKEQVEKEPEGTEGQDRENYTDDQDRENYTTS